MHSEISEGFEHDKTYGSSLGIDTTLHTGSDLNFYFSVFFAGSAAEGESSHYNSTFAGLGLEKYLNEDYFVKSSFGIHRKSSLLSDEDKDPQVFKGPAFQLSLGRVFNINEFFSISLSNLLHTYSVNNKPKVKKEGKLGLVKINKTKDDLKGLIFGTSIHFIFKL